MSEPSKLEQQMLVLINQERTSRGIDALAFDPLLNDSSEDHSSWMLGSGVFSHTGSGSSSSHQRMKAAGFQFEGAWRSAENIAYQSERGSPGYEDDIANLHDALMNSPGHRANILNPELSEIGIGVVTGSGTLARGFDVVVVTQNFAHTTATDPVVVEFVPAPDPKPTATETDAKPQPVVFTPPAEKIVVESPVPDEQPVRDVPSSDLPVKDLPQKVTFKDPTPATDADDGTPALMAKFGGMFAGWQKAAEKFQSFSDAWQAKADASPAQASLYQARADKWQSKVDGLEVSIERWIDKKSNDWSKRADTDGDAQISVICDHIGSWNVTWGGEFCDYG